MELHRLRRAVAGRPHPLLRSGDRTGFDFDGQSDIAGGSEAVADVPDPAVLTAITAEGETS